MSKTPDFFVPWTGAGAPGATLPDSRLSSAAPLAPSGAVVAGVRRIAVLRANGLGDFVFTLPALDALRRAYPEAEIVLLGLPWQREFLSGRPGPVDRVVVVPAARGVGAPADAAEDADALARFFAAMREERFDLALQLHGGGRYSNPFVNRLAARVTAGLKTPDAEPLDRWMPYVYYQPEVFRFVEAVALVGACAETWEPQIATTDADRDCAARAVPASGRPLALLHVGAGDGRRRWAADRFARVGDALAAAGADVVINGTGDERPIVAAVRTRMTQPSLDLGAGCSLACLAGVLARAAVVVSNDSGPLHLARALGAATVGIYWCGNLLNAGPTTRTHHRPCVSWRLQCPVCGTNTIAGRCGHDASFVDDVRADDVIDAALDLLARAAARPAAAYAEQPGGGSTYQLPASPS